MWPWNRPTTWGEIRAHPLLAVFTGIEVGVVLGCALR
jgi:hypothetical protein